MKPVYPINEPFPIDTDGKTLGIEGKTYLIKPIGPGTWTSLNENAHREGFRQASFPEIIALMNAVIGYTDKRFEKLLRTLTEETIVGNTAILLSPRGTYVQDFPEIKKGRIHMDGKTLDRLLGSLLVNCSLRYSDDLLVRKIIMKDSKELYNESISSADRSNIAGRDKFARMCSLPYDEELILRAIETNDFLNAGRLKRIAEQGWGRNRLFVNLIFGSSEDEIRIPCLCGKNIHDALIVSDFSENSFDNAYTIAVK